jgi:predicted DNA-binding transcriptional regulator AlpA
MNQQIYRIKQLCTTPGKPGLLPVGRATIWRWVSAGTFPKPFKIGLRCTVWDAAAVDNWLKQQREAAK